MASEHWIAAHFALFVRTVEEKNFPVRDWTDTGIRGGSSEQCLAQWQERPAVERDWQEVMIRLVPASDAGTPRPADDDDEVGLECADDGD